MKPKLLIDPRVRAAFQAHPPARRWILATLVALAACGVGVGGTGTGEAALQAFGAERVAICTSALASTAGCLGQTTAPGQGTQFFADAGAAGAAGAPTRHLARLEGDDLVLELRCERRRFVGTLGSAPGLGLRWYGELQGDAAGVAPALATVQATTGGSVPLMLQLFDAAGAPMGAPLLLAAVPGATPLPALPC
jgi:hypothetical protein